MVAFGQVSLALERCVPQKEMLSCGIVERKGGDDGVVRGGSEFARARVRCVWLCLRLCRRLCCGLCVGCPGLCPVVCVAPRGVMAWPVASPPLAVTDARLAQNVKTCRSAFMAQWLRLWKIKGGDECCEKGGVRGRVA